MLNQILDICTIIIVLLPPAVQITSQLAQQTHNKKLQNLSDRANIIVNALEQSGLTGPEKKAQGLAKLSNYATEVGIKLTSDQVDDYIEAAVRFMKLAGNENVTSKEPELTK